MRWQKIWGLVLVFCLMMPVRVWAETGQEEPRKELEGLQDTAPSIEEFRTEDIQQFLDSLARSQGGAAGRFSFEEMMDELMAGNLADVLKQGASDCTDVLFSEIRTNRSLMGQIIILAIIGAVFSGFSGIFGSGHVTETGFYVVYLLIMTFLAASFFSSVGIASRVTGELLEFMKVLLPAYFLAVAAAGGALTSAAVCGFTFGAIGVVQVVLAELLIPLTRIYMLLVLAGNLMKEDMISKCTELLEHVILWTLKTMFGIVVGFHVVQSMILPQADALKNASVMRLAQIIPGVGAAAGSITQMILGSGVLIKNTAGVAGVLVMIFMAAVPLIKLLILMCFYYLAGAVMQPVCDKRLVACMTGAAVGHGILLKIVAYSMALFAATIAVLCISTNGVW